MKKTKLVKAAGIIMFVTLVSKVLGFFRDALIASSFGATYKTDAYNIAMTIPDVLFAIFSLAITTTFIPLLSETYEKKGKDEMFKFANNIMNILLVILILLSILGWQFSGQLVKLIAPKFTGKTYDLTVTLTRLSVINIIFMGINGGYNSILQTMDDFIAPSLVGIMLNLPIIIYILMGAKGGVIGLTIANVIGNVLKVVIQLPWLYKHGYRIRYALNLRDSRIGRMMLLIIPVLIGAGSNQINAIVDKNIGSGLPTGSISALNFSSKINDIVYMTFAAAIVTVIYPALSREASVNNISNFKSYVIKGVNNISLIMIPSTLLMIILGNPIVTILFKHGVFDNRAVTMTVIALIYYSVGLPFYGIRDVFNRSLYAFNDTKSSTINGVICVGINIVLNLILPRFMGIGGIALSTSIAAIVSTFMLANILRKRIGPFGGKKLATTTIKITLASIAMGIVSYGVYKPISLLLHGFIGGLVALVISFGFSAIVYVFALRLLKVEEIFFVFNIIKSKLRCRSNA